ncbi:MAG: tetratricopeptide repeat protein [Candidatus Electrothrix aestuarii]|uniref:Tetratricopeptide repeat protein n=1 Tax=Candidatus Electrothrix aestuarii TaxID=3062594 RepID=A0AAU8LUJ3_9BACT
MAVYSPAMTFFKRDRKMDNHFESKGGEQNIAQGENPIGKQVNNYGVPPETLISYAEEFGVTKSALTSFFKILEQEQVPAWELDSKLREIAMRHKELLERFNTISSDDPEVRNLKAQAKDAIEDGRFSEAEDLLAQARERDREAIARMKAAIEEQQAALEKRQLSEAESCVDQAKLQRLQYHHAKSADYLQVAAAALPEGRKWERAEYLGEAGVELYRVSCYVDALNLYKQSISLYRDIGDRKNEGLSLNNIGLIYKVQGDHRNALKFLEQSLSIAQELGDKTGEGATLNNISNIYQAKGDYAKALTCLKQALSLLKDAGNKEGEGWSLNNIGEIYRQQRNYPAALPYYEQSLAIRQAIKDKRGESATLNNISLVYIDQGKLNTAFEYLKQSLMISQDIGDRRQEGATLHSIGLAYRNKEENIAALKHYEQSLTIKKEIGDKAGEVDTYWNIGDTYGSQGELAKAEPYFSRAVELMEQLEAPDLENARKVLEAVRAALRGPA